MAVEHYTAKVGEHEVTFTRVDGEKVQGFSNLSRQKIVPREQLEALGEFYRMREIPIAFTTGVFDVLHRGHARYLQLAASLGNGLVVGLNSDSSVRTLKGPERPILNEAQRAEMLCFLASVTWVTIFPELTGAEVIRILKPDAYLCVEGSWNGDIASKEEVQAMAEHGGKVFYAPRQDPQSSTSDIIGIIEQRHGERVLPEFSKLMSGNNGLK